MTDFSARLSALEEPNHALDARNREPAAVAPAVPRLPEGIEGLDVKGGLTRMMGKKPLYLAMLRKYAAGQKNVPAQIRQALDAGDWALAERLAHTLRGVAATIGATQIPGLAGALEQALKAKAAQDEINRLVSALEIPLGAQIAALETQLPPDIRTAPAPRAQATASVF